MSIKLVKKSNAPTARSASSLGDVFGLQRDIDSLFSSFLRDFGDTPAITNTPSLISPKSDLAETEKEFHISVELPGIDEKDFEVSLENSVLTISGHKENKSEEEDKDYHRVERSYGSFQRSIALPENIVEDKIEANFKNGVLDVTIPKAKEEKNSPKKIPVKTS